MSQRVPIAEEISAELRLLWRTVEAVCGDGRVEPQEMVALQNQYEPLQERARRAAVAVRVGLNIARTGHLDKDLASELGMLRREEATAPGCGRSTAEAA